MGRIPDGGPVGWGGGAEAKAGPGLGWGVGGRPQWPLLQPCPCAPGSGVGAGQGARGGCPLPRAAARPAPGRPLHWGVTFEGGGPSRPTSRRIVTKMAGELQDQNAVYSCASNVGDKHKHSSHAKRNSDARSVLGPVGRVAMRGPCSSNLRRAGSASVTCNTCCGDLRRAGHPGATRGQCSGKLRGAGRGKVRAHAAATCRRGGGGD
jgi:hypothetical protein